VDKFRSYLKKRKHHESPLQSPRMGYFKIFRIYYQVLKEDDVNVYFAVGERLRLLSSKGKFYTLCLKEKGLRGKGCLSKKDKV
jgi:hypothetical protein